MHCELPRSRKAPAQDIDNWPRLVQIAWIRCDENGAESEKSFFLTAEFIRAGMDAEFSAQTMICAKEEATEYCGIPGPYGNKWPTLAELHDTLFEADFDQTHDALDDVEACARCFFELVKRGVIEEPRADAFLA